MEKTIYITIAIISTLMFILLLALIGMLGPTAAGIAIIILKYVGLAYIWFLMVRIPIAIVKSRRSNALNDIRRRTQDDAMAKLRQAYIEKRKDVVNIIPPKDHPLNAVIGEE